ncbi:MAG: hypothetical protein O3A46_15645 [Candidatus Poribacteria bacterium]|nr:hypothetical protein [Candidatus Poribacteria bacterium]
MATELRREIRQLVDALPEEDLLTVARMLKGLVFTDDEPLYTLDSCPEGEPPSAEEEDAIHEAHTDIEAGRVYSHEDVKKRLGLS